MKLGVGSPDELTTGAADEVSGTGRPTGQPSPVRPAPRRLLPTAVVIVVYLSIGVAAFWPVYPGISRHLFGYGSDFTLTLWELNWLPHALAHGLNPFFSNAIYVPTGVNLAQNTSAPLLGIITAPFAPVFSPVVRANLLMVLAMPISATAAFVVFRKWQVWGPAAALGGLIYGFSPYMVGQSINHLELFFVPLPPFIALTVASILQNRGSPQRLGLQLGLLVVAQYLISPEVLATVAILTVAAVVCVAIRNPATVRNMVRAASRATGIAVAVAAVLLAYPIWMGFDGPQHFTGPPFSTPNPYHNDLLSFVVPGPLQRVSLGMSSIGARLTGNSGLAESGGYIGVPVIILTGILAVRSRRSPRTQLAVVLLLGAALLSLGPHLAIDGRLTDIPLPFLLLEHLPLVNGILPARISLEVDACLAAVIAFGLDDMRRAPVGRRSRSARGHWIRSRRSAVFAGAILAWVAVATQVPLWPQSFSTAQPAVSLPATLTRAIPSGDPVAITYPYDTKATNEPMLWQAEDDFRFRLLGGYAWTTYVGYGGVPSLLPSVMSPPGTQQFLAGQEGLSFFGPGLRDSPKLVAITRSVVSRYHIRLVIVDRSMSGSGPVMELFTNALGPPTLSAGQFSMWANWHGRPSHEQFSSHLVTSMARTSSGKVSGTTVLDATATGSYRVTKVDFLLTDGSHHSTLIASGTPTFFGWIAKWNSTSVANGTYSLQSIAYDETGARRPSSSITIMVQN
jgi:hypothetical protein